MAIAETFNRKIFCGTAEQAGNSRKLCVIAAKFYKQGTTIL